MVPPMFFAHLSCDGEAELVDAAVLLPEAEELAAQAVSHLRETEAAAGHGRRQGWGYDGKRRW